MENKIGHDVTLLNLNYNRIAMEFNWRASDKIGEIQCFHRGKIRGGVQNLRPDQLFKVTEIK